MIDMVLAQDDMIGWDQTLLDILVCPVSGGTLEYDSSGPRLLSKKAGLAFPIRRGIAIMLVEEAEKIT